MDISLHLSTPVCLIPLAINFDKRMLIACCRSKAEQEAAIYSATELQQIAQRLNCQRVGIRLGARMVCEMASNHAERIQQFFRDHGQGIEARPHKICTHTSLEDAAIHWQNHCHTNPKPEADLTILVVDEDGVRLFACSTMRQGKGHE